MDVMAIVIATAVVAVIGLIVGLGLGLFGEKFKVEVDEKEMAVREVRLRIRGLRRFG